MLGTLKKKNAREEEKKKEEEEKKAEIGSTGDAQQVQPTRIKTTPGEIRFKKDLLELDLPPHAETNFPD